MNATAGTYDYGENVRFPEASSELWIPEEPWFPDPEIQVPDITGVVSGPFNPPIVDDFNRADGPIGSNWATEGGFYDLPLIRSNAVATSQNGGGASNGGAAYVAPPSAFSFDFAVTIAVPDGGTGQMIIEAINEAGLPNPPLALWQGWAAIIRGNTGTSGYIDIYEFNNDSANYITTAVDTAGPNRVAPYLAGTQVGIRVLDVGWEVYSRDSAVDTWRLNYSNYVGQSNAPFMKNVGVARACIRLDWNTDLNARFDDFRYAGPDTTPPTPNLTTGSARMSAQTGKDTFPYSFTVDEACQAYQIRVVNSSGDPFPAGTLVEAGGAIAAGGTASGSISYTELVAAALTNEGGMVVKVFVQDSAGNWSV